MGMMLSSDSGNGSARLEVQEAVIDNSFILTVRALGQLPALILTLLCVFCLLRRENVCVCVTERESVCLCVCETYRLRERERAGQIYLL